MTPREHFVANGRLTKCTNPSHLWDWRRLVLVWQWSTDKKEIGWCDITDKGYLMTKKFSVATVENTDGTLGWQIVIGRLLILAGLRPKD